jgi:hypothetical protein
MRKAWLMLVLLAASTRLFAAENQAYLAILAETRVHKMAGMPAISELPPGLDLSAMPGLASMLSGAPEKSLEVRLWSPGIAPADAAASIAPPAGLQLGKKLDLALYRPKADAETAPSGPGEFDPDSVKGFTIKIYWGSSDTVKPGQPKVVKWEGLTAEQKQAMKKQASETSAGGAYFYKPNWTTGYWPTPKQPGKIAQGASLVGDYALTTSYTGNVTISAPPDVNFLAPFDLTSPKLDAAVPLDKPIALAWKQIPNALGLHAAIFGMEGKNTLILWSSAEVYTDDMLTDWGYLQMSRVRELVGLTAMMMGDRTSVTVPAGIFANSDIAMLTMVGYGPGAALDQGQPLPRIQTKTTLTATLGGKAMSGLDGLGGTGEVGDTGDADF